MNPKLTKDWERKHTESAKIIMLKSKLKPALHWKKNLNYYLNRKPENNSNAFNYDDFYSSLREMNSQPLSVGIVSAPFSLTVLVQQTPSAKIIGGIPKSGFTKAVSIPVSPMMKTSVLGRKPTNLSVNSFKSAAQLVLLSPQMDTAKVRSQPVQIRLKEEPIEDTHQYATQDFTLNKVST